MSYKQKSLILYILLFVFLIAMFTQKQSFHVDEVWSYGLANYDGNAYMQVEDGKQYNGEELYHRYMTVQEGQRFDYSKVWENQRNDNHPVLFYLLLHTISSFFPGKFSLWFGAAINIVFALVLLLYVRKLLLLLTHSRQVQTMCSLAFVTTYGIVNAMFFIRMYVMVMALQTMLSYLCLLLLEQEKGNDIPEDLETHSKWFTLYSIFAVTYFSALTHYYCIVYAVFLTLTLLVALLFQKRWKTALQLFGTQALAGLLALVTFPAMLERVFGGDRGAQSMENLKSFEGGEEGRLSLFLSFINKELFGGLALLVLGLCAVLLLYSLFAKKKVKTRALSFRGSLVLLFPVLVYFFVIELTAPLQVSRYLYPLYPVIFVLVVAWLGVLLEVVFPNRQKLAAVILAVTLFLTVVSSYFNRTERRYFEYLYPEAKVYLSTAAEYQNCNCLFIYHWTYEVMTSYKELSQYRSVTFLRDTELDQLDDLAVAKDKELIVRTVNIQDWYETTGVVMEHYSQFTNAEQLFRYAPDGITSILT